MDEARRARRVLWRCAGVTALAAALLFLAVRGCAFMPWNRVAGKLPVRVTVTRDFGAEVLKDEAVEVREGSSAMQALREVAEVETAYGGGFINGIDGLASGYGGEHSLRTDWFYYLNGQMADVGAGDLEVSAGDWLLFDYHSWERSVFTPAFAGCFPEPFVHGYREPPSECLVVCAPGWEEEGGELAARLREAGAPSCGVAELSREWEPRRGVYAVVLGAAGELGENAFLEGANRNAARLGMPAYFHGDDILVVDEKGEARERLSSGDGLVEAIGPRLGEEGSALMVTGTDAEGVMRALEVLARWDNALDPPLMAMIVRAGGGGAYAPLR